MIPVEIRMALWDLMDAIEFEPLSAEEKVVIEDLYGACQRAAHFINHQEKKEAACHSTPT